MDGFLADVLRPLLLSGPRLVLRLRLQSLLVRLEAVYQRKFHQDREMVGPEAG